jgi:hypothetical protein
MAAVAAVAQIHFMERQRGLPTNVLRDTI